MSLDLISQWLATRYKNIFINRIHYSLSIHQINRSNKIDPISEWRLEKIVKAHGPKNQAGFASLIWKKGRISPKSNKKWGRTLHIHQWKIPPRWYFNSEHLSPKYKGIVICKIYITKAVITHLHTWILHLTNDY